MKITILGAGGVRSPLLLNRLSQKAETLGITKIALFDTHQAHLTLIQTLTNYLLQDVHKSELFEFCSTSEVALEGADFVISTFRQGGMEGRVIDERIPLKHGVLGQETTGPGGFSMALRTIPAMLQYLEIMRRVCPNAWLINFANPSGLVTEAVIRLGGWEKCIGICDGPESIREFIANLLGTTSTEIQLDYFGLNHLGWVRKIIYESKNFLPDFLEGLPSEGKVFGIPFDNWLIKSLGMYPNEYLYYYYYRSTAVEQLRNRDITRGEYLKQRNELLFKELKEKAETGAVSDMAEEYWSYMVDRTDTYMAEKKEKTEINLHGREAESFMGYANVAFRVIEGLTNGKVDAIVNVQNHGAIQHFDDDVVVEIPVDIENGNIKRREVSSIPNHCLNLMAQVKSYELKTIQAIQEQSYNRALEALSFHPLVMDVSIARKILDEYIKAFGSAYPPLK